MAPFVLRCPDCGRDVPEVLGAQTQECPHCGAEVAIHEAMGAADGSGVVDAAGAAAEAFRFARRHYGAVLLLWVPALVVDVAATLAISYYQSSHGLPQDVATATLAQQLALLGIALPLLFLTFVLKLALFAPVGGHVLDRTGATPPGRSALAATVRSPLRLLALGLVLALLCTAGFFLLLVGLLVFYHWFQFAPVALADRQKGIGDAFDASRRFAKERRALGFTALSFFVLLGVVAADQVLEWGGGRALAALGLTGPWPEAIVGGVALWLVTPIMAILPAAYWALATRAPAQPAPAASGAATPALAFRTTKCPQCGTLIPYAATGAPVDVECPVCQRKGRVL
jgi:hypothetical protein